MTDLLNKIQEEIVNEARGHDSTKDMFMKNFNAIYNDTHNLDPNFKYFTRENCIFHHINGDHSLDNIANVLLIRSNDNKRELSTAVHMLIHMHALLVYLANQENNLINLRLFNFDFAELKDISLWTFKAPSDFKGTQENDFQELVNYMQNLNDDDIKVKNRLKNREQTDKVYTRLATKKSYNKRFSLEQLSFNAYLKKYGELLANAESTKNFLGKMLSESMNKSITRQLKEAINGLTKTLNENGSRCNGYGNQLMDLSYALKNKDKCLEEIKWGNFGILDAGAPLKTGCYYVLPDGRAITAKNHADIDRFLIRQGFIKPKEGHTRKEIYDNFDYGDGSQFLEAIGCIRLRRRGGADSWMLPYLTLSNSRPTTIQYEKMIQWLDFVLEASGVVQVVAPANVDGVINDSHIYKKSLGDTTDDIIEGIKFFYRTKSLPEDLIDYTDNEKQLEEAAQTWRCFEQF